MHRIYKRFLDSQLSAAGGSPIKALGVVALVLLLCACQKAGHEYLAEARQDLANSAYTEAIAAADAGLVADPDPVSAWGLELVKLEAQARAGLGEEAKEQLDALAHLYPKQLTPAEFSSTAQQLKQSGQRVPAIEVLDMGAKLYPQDAVIARMIEELASGDGASPEELKMLRSLGYIE